MIRLYKDSLEVYAGTHWNLNKDKVSMCNELLWKILRPVTVTENKIRRREESIK